MANPSTPNRLLYSSQSLLVSSGLYSPNLTELERVLSINHGANIARQDVTVFGSRAPIDRIIVDAPTVSMDISYLVTDGTNENALGLFVNPTGANNPVGVGNGLLTNLLNSSRDEQNYFIKVVGADEDADVDTITAASGVIGFGNASLASYSVEARLGGFATASARLAGLNLTYQTNTLAADNPAIDPTDGAPLTGAGVPAGYTIPTTGISYVGAVNAIRPGDIQLKLPAIFALNTICPQSFTLTVDMTREALRCLGTKFRYANEINFPLNATLSMEVLVRDFNNNQKLTQFLCSDNDETAPLEIMLRKPPTCVNGGEDLPAYDPNNPDARDADNFLVYSLRGARFESMTFNNGVGQGETATINYTVSIGSPKDVNHNIFLYSTQTNS